MCLFSEVRDARWFSGPQPHEINRFPPWAPAFNSRVDLVPGFPQSQYSFIFGPWWVMICRTTTTDPHNQGGGDATSTDCPPPLLGSHTKHSSVSRILASSGAAPRHVWDPVAIPVVT